MDKKFQNLVGGKIKEYKENVSDSDDGFIVTKGKKKYFLGFTDYQEVYVEELGVTE